MFRRSLVIGWLVLVTAGLAAWPQGIVGPGQMNQCDQASFTITVSNGSVSQDACKLRITNTVPNGGFAYVPGSATITLHETLQTFHDDPVGDVWDIDAILGAAYALPPGETITISFDLATDCSAVSGTDIVTVDFEDCAAPGVPLQNVSSTSIEILPGAIIVMKTPSTTTASVGDQVTWTITVENTGLGAVKNVVITDLLGPGLAFAAAPEGGQNDGQETVWDPATTPALAEIATGETVNVQLTAELISCSGLYNDVDARWGCSVSNACDDTAVDGGTATASITLVVDNPSLAFSPPNVTVPYCGNAEGIQIQIANSGTGTARQVELCCTLALLTVANVQGGATYTDGCFSIPDIPPGETFTLTFDGIFTGDWCAGGPSGLNVFTLDYANDCGIPFLGHPQFSTCSSEPGPSLNVTKAGPEALRLGETGRYDLAVAYDGSTSCGGSPGPVTIVDTYPEGFTVLDAAGGIHDPVDRTITWTYDPNTEPPFARTIELEAPTGCGACASPAGGTDPNTLVATGTDCCGCAISGSAEVPTTILCEGFGDDTAYFSSAISLSTDTAIRCLTPAILTVTHTYTFSSDAALDDFLLNEFTYFVDGNGDFQYEPATASVTGATLGSVADSTPAGRLELPLTDNASVSGRTITYTYDLRVLGLDDPSCQATSYPVYAGIDIHPDATSIGYCGTMYSDPPVPRVTAQPPAMSVSIDGVPVIQEDCATYDITVTVTRNSALAVPYDARLVLTNAGGSLIAFPDPASCTGVPAVDGTTCTAPIVQANAYEWRFADGFEGGNTATIPLRVTVPCDGPLIDLAATVSFDDLCNDDSVYGDSCSSSTSESAALQLAADVYTRKSPEILYATEKTVQWTVVVHNTGNAVAYNTWVDDVLGSGLIYDQANSDPAGATEVVNLNHLGTAINGVSYLFDELQPGELRTITVAAELIACDGLTNDVAVAWGCGGDDCQPPRTDESIVVIPVSNLVATSFSPTPIPMCSENPATVTVKNAGVTTVYDIVANVTLPDGLVYAGNPEVSIDNGSTWLPAGEPAISGQDLTWTQAEIATLADAAPNEVIMIRFDYIVDCGFDGGDLTFQAGYEDPCGSPKATGIGRFTISLVPAEVSTTLRQISPAPGEAIDCGGQATWEIDVVNEGSIVVPVIRVEALLDDGLVFVNAQGDPVYGPSDDGSNTGQIVFWEIADFPIDATATLTLTAASAGGGLDCEALDILVDATWGCGLVDGSSFTNDADCLTNAPASATISGARQPPVDLNATLSVNAIEGCADTSTLTLEIRNIGSTSTVSNVDVQVDLPAQLAYTGGSTQIDCGGGFSPAGDPSESGSLLTWYDVASDGGANDLCASVAPGDTIRLQFDVDVACYFSTQNIPVTVKYKDCCGLSQYTATTSATLTSLIPNLAVSKTPDVTGLDCANPLDEVTWTIRVTNNGAGTADVVRIEDTLGIDLVHVSGGTQLGSDPQRYGWEFGPLAPGAFHEVTLTARLAAPPDDCDVTRRTNTARAIWGCGSFDGDPNTTAEYACPGTVWRQDTAVIQIANLAIGEADIVPIYTCEGDGIGSGSLQITVRNTNDGQITQDFSIAINESTTGWSVTDTFTNLGGSLPITANSAQTLTVPGWPVACADCAYQFTVTVDTAGSVCECSEGNNSTVLDYVLTTPNLVFDTADLSVACSGDESVRIQGTVTVRNAGCGDPLTDTIPMRVTVYDAAGCAGNVLDQFTVDLTGADIAAGGTQTFNLDRVRAMTGCGTCEISIRLELDPEDAICECDGTDNALCVGPFAIATPDLTITQIDTSGIVCSNDAIAGEVVLTIENAGCGDAAAFDLALATDGCLVFSAQRIAGLNAGTQTTVSFPVASLWADCADCSCTFTATIDASGEICECDGTNNELQAVYASAWPDLEVLAAAATLACAADGESQVLVNLTVENTGCGPADAELAAQITLYDGPDCTGNIVDQWTAELGTLTITAGGTQAVALPGHTVAAGLCASDCGYSVRVELDPDHRVCECDGTDNAFCISPVVSNTPNLIVTKIDPAVDCRAGTAQVLVNVENTGCGDASGIVIDLASSGCGVSLTSAPIDIAAGDSATVTLTYTPACSDWNCDYTATVDLAGSVCECDGTDNSLEHTPYPGDGSIGDTVWFDADGDGVQDPGEDGIPNVTVILEGDLDGDGLLDYTAEIATAADGTYLFDGLPAGDYTVTVDQGTLPDGLAQTYDADGLGTPHTSDLALGLNEDNLDQDFGYRGTGSIGDTVWFDVNADGVQDPGELGIPNVTVTLRGDIDGDGIVETVSTATDADGQYLFEALPAGNYTITVDDGTLPPGLEQTYDYDGLGSPHTSDYALAAGEHNREQDFGYAAPALRVDKIVADILRNGMSQGIAGPVEPGDLVIYRFLIENIGPVPAYNVGFSDTLPNGLTITTAPPADAGTFTVSDPANSGSLAVIDGSSSFTASIGATLAPAATLSADFTARVSSSIEQGTSLINTATAFGEGVDGTPIPLSNTLLGDTADMDAEDPDADDTGIAVLGATEPALSVDKTITDIRRNGESIGIAGPVEPGDVVFYRFVIVNVGQATAYSVNFTDTLPAGLRVETDAPGNPGTFSVDDPSASGSLGLADGVSAFTTSISAEIAGGGTLTADFAAVVTSDIVQGVDLVNTATATGVDGAATPIPEENAGIGDTSDADAEDPDADDTGIAVIATDEPALSVDKVIADIVRQGQSIGSTGPVEPGDVMVYRYTIRNVGLGTAYAVDFTDTLPFGLEIETGSPGHAGTWAVTAPAAAGSLGLTDGTESFTTTISATVAGGGSLIAEYAVRVTSAVEQGVDLINVAAAVGLDGAGNPIPGANADLGDTADDDAEDPDADDTGITVVSPIEPALSVDKRVTDIFRNGVSTGVIEPLLFNDVVEYTVTIRNVGAGTAYGVELADSLPNGLEIETESPGSAGSYQITAPSASGSLGLADGATAFATALSATIAGGETLTLVYTAVITPEAAPSVDLINTAAAAGRDGAGAPIPGENAALGDTSDDDSEDPDADDTGIAIVRVGAPALVTRKAVASIHRFGAEVSGNAIEPGDRVVYEVGVANVGDGPAHRVNVRDLLPRGLAYEGNVSAVWPGGSSSGAPSIGAGPDGATELLWNLEATLEADDELVLRFDARVTSDVHQGETLTNSIFATGEDAAGVPIPPDNRTMVSDDDDLDDASSVDLTPVEPALVTAKAVADVRRDGRSLGSITTIQENDIIVFSLLVTNVGRGSAYNVDVRDELPAPFAYVAGSTQGIWPQRLGTYGAEPLGASSRILTWNTNASLRGGEALSLRFEARVAGSIRSAETYVNAMTTIGVDGNGSEIPANNASDVPEDKDLDDADRVELAGGATVPALQTRKTVLEIIRGNETARDGRIEAGDVIEFELQVENVGPADAIDIAVTDELPEVFSYLPGTSVAITPDGTASREPVAGSGRLSWDLGADLALGERVAIRFRAAVLGPLVDGRSYVNRMSASGKDNTGAPIPTDQSDRVAGDNDPDDADSVSLTARSQIVAGAAGSIEVPILRKAAETLGNGPCQGWTASWDRIWFQTDIALFAATEFAALASLPSDSAQSTQTLLPTWLRTVQTELAVYGLDNLLQVEGLSSIGISLEQGPRIEQAAARRRLSPDQALEWRLGELADTAGLRRAARPAGFEWIYLEFAGGEPRMDTSAETAWGPAGTWTVLDRGIEASALGMGLLKQAEAAEALLAAATPDERFLGWVLCEAMANKLVEIEETLTVSSATGVHLPHRTLLPEHGEAFLVDDASTSLFDQIALVWGASRVLQLIEAHGSTWPAGERELRETLREGAQNLLSLAVRTINTRHHTSRGEWFSEVSATGNRGGTASATELGLLLAAWSEASGALAAIEGAEAIETAAIEQLIAWQRSDGTFESEHGSDSFSDLAEQLGGLRGLLAAFAQTGDPTLETRAQIAFDALDTLWMPQAGHGIYPTQTDPFEACYTPLEIGLAVGALRELAQISDPDRSDRILERLSSLVRSIVDEAALQLSNGRLESFAAGDGAGAIFQGAWGAGDLAPVLQESLCLEEARSANACAAWRLPDHEPWYQTDIAMYAAFTLQERLPDLQDAADANLVSIDFHSGFGLSFEALPELRTAARGLVSDSNFDPIAVPFYSGAPWSDRDEALAWNPSTFDTRIVPSALGMTLLREAQELEQILDRATRTEAQTIEARVLLAAVFAKIDTLEAMRIPGPDAIVYLPHAVEWVTGTVAGNPRVLASESTLFDQASVLLGLAQAHRLLGRQDLAPWTAHLPYDAEETANVLRTLADTVLATMETAHVRPDEQALDDRANTAPAGWRPSGRITIKNLALTVEALESAIESFGPSDPLTTRARTLLSREVAFLRHTLTDGSGTVIETWTADAMADNACEEPTFSGQLAGIRVLLAAHRQLGTDAEELWAAFQAIESSYWDHALQLYRETREGLAWCITPFEFALAVSTHSQMQAFAEPAEAGALARRLSRHADRVLDGMDLQLPGDRIDDPSLPRLAWVFERRVCAESLEAAGAATSSRPGDTVRYAIETENLTTEPFVDLRLTDRLPAGVTYLSSSPSGVTNQGDGTVAWTLDRLEPGERREWEILVQVDPKTPLGSSLENCATMTYTNEDGDDLPDREACAQVMVQSAELAAADRLASLRILYETDEAMRLATAVGEIAADPGQPDEIRLMAKGLAAANLGVLLSESGLGVPLALAPSFEGAGTLDAMLKTMASNAGLSSVPVMRSPIFLPAASAVPILERGIGFSERSDVLTPEALGWTLARQAQVLAGQAAIETALQRFLRDWTATVTSSQLRWLDEAMSLPANGRFLPNAIRATWAGGSATYAVSDTGSSSYGQASLLIGLLRISHADSVDQSTRQRAEQLAADTFGRLQTCWSDQGVLLDATASDRSISWPHASAVARALADAPALGTREEREARVLLSSLAGQAIEAPVQGSPEAEAARITVLLVAGNTLGDQRILDTALAAWDRFKATARRENGNGLALSNLLRLGWPHHPEQLAIGFELLAELERSSAAHTSTARQAESWMLVHATLGDGVQLVPAFGYWQSHLSLPCYGLAPVTATWFGSVEWGPGMR